MVKTVEDKQRFVELRAKGLSFERIAEELKVSKPTLIKWSEELFHEVQEAEFYELENLLENYKLMRKQRFENYCKLLSSALAELESRAAAGKLQEVPTEKLLNMAEQLEKRIQQETKQELVSVTLGLGDFKIGTEKFLEAG
jgi:transcriptional regulator with XRE-family HTH domain